MKRKPGTYVNTVSRELPCGVCGIVNLPVVIVPGTDGDTATLWSMDKPTALDTFTLTRPVADRVFCSLDCARTAGWPWLRGESTARREGARA